MLERHKYTARAERNVSGLQGKMYLIQNKIFEGLRPRDSEYLLVEGDNGC